MKKYKAYLTQAERKLAIDSLINARNTLISQGKYTDLVDELLVKIINAKLKNCKN